MLVAWAWMGRLGLQRPTAIGFAGADADVASERRGGKRLDMVEALEYHYAQVQLR